jgi:hypothetical protein
MALREESPFFASFFGEAKKEGPPAGRTARATAAGAAIKNRTNKKAR